MTILIVLATTFLILDCLLLGLLILVQLPKKDAGVGMAFGGGAADALFGAGSGTALSQLTKYTAIIFFVLVFVLSIMNNHNQTGNGAELKSELNKVPAAAPATTTPAPAKPGAAVTPAIPLTISTNSSATTVAPASTNTAKPK